MTRGRQLILALGCAAWTALFALLHFAGFTPLLHLEAFTEDLRTRLGSKALADPRLVFIGIDQATYRDVPLAQDEQAQESRTLQSLRTNFPWSRIVWADVIERLVQAGAKVVILDLIFAAPSDGDEELAAVLQKYPQRVVIGSNFSDTHAGTGLQQTLPCETLLQPTNNLSISYDPRVGYVNVWPDWDGVVRRAYFALSDAALLDAPGEGPANAPNHESLAARALRQAGMAYLIPQADRLIRFRYTAPPGLGYPALALNTIFSANIWKQNYRDGEFFRDKIIIVGPSANVFHDEHTSPFTLPRPQMLGPEIHLNIINAALRNDYLSESGPGPQAALIIGAGLLALILGAYVPHPVWRLGLVALTSCAWIGVVQGLHDWANQVVFCTSPLLTLNLASLTTFAYDYTTERRERARVRKTLERYVSKNVVGALLDNPEPYMNSLGGVRRKVTVLFADLRNFPSLTETSSEAQVVQQLNEYFSEMVNQVFSCDGTLDKYIGDALMAVWGNLLTAGAANDARHAVETALRMQVCLQELNKNWRARQRPTLSAGIGINHGPAIVGNIGSNEKMELTVIGDTINLASRLESLTKLYKLDLLLGESVAQLVNNNFLLRSVDRVAVQGKAKPADIFTVMGSIIMPAPAWLLDYEKGVHLYRSRDFNNAVQHFARALEMQPGDYLCRLYLDRCQLLQDNPPAPDWNGTFIATSK
jgi:adenylate cyclase